MIYAVEDNCTYCYLPLVWLSACLTIYYTRKQVYACLIWRGAFV